MTRAISSSEVTPARQSRIPSSRSVIIPAPTAAAKISSVDASIRCRILPLIGITSYSATRPL